MSAMREELHHLVDQLPEAELRPALELIRGRVAEHDGQGRDLPFFDRGVSALVGDLHERGLANDVVVVMWGEFGRTPRINRAAGRDHWPAVMSALVAGGGLRVGQVIGSTTARGEQPRERRCTVSQVLATLYRAVGIDPAMTFPNRSGRPVHVLDDREPVRELL